MLVLLTLLTSGPSSVSALPVDDQSPADQIDLDPTILENSPVLQRWLEDVPDLQSDIARDPSFRTRLRLGYTANTNHHNAGVQVGVEDIFVDRTRLTVSGDYRTNFGNSNEQYGVDLRYHLLPLGRRVNVAPVVGYRSVSEGKNDTDGVNLGLRLIVVPSRTGAADISLSQTWVAPGNDHQAISRFTVSAGYAIAPSWRVSSDIQIQTSERDQNTTVGILLEWLP